MNLSKLVRQEAKVSTLFPITHLNSPSIFESQSGMLGAVVKMYAFGQIHLLVK